VSHALVYYPGYVHTLCGGEAEVASSPHLGAYCVLCVSHVPRTEVRRENGDEKAERESRPLWYQDQLDAMRTA
jgi:hypothetical protein